MSCKNCNTGNNGLPKGCNNNGSCSSGSCGTFTVFDWLADISLNISDQFKIVEVRFKNGRKGSGFIFQNIQSCTHNFSGLQSRY